MADAARLAAVRWDDVELGLLVTLAGLLALGREGDQVATRAPLRIAVLLPA
jgi:hypothetical protein